MKRLSSIFLISAAAFALGGCMNAGSSGPGSAPKPGPDITQLTVDCICDNGAYIDGYHYSVPWTGSSLKIGSVISLAAQGCGHPAACPSNHALAGTYKLKLEQINMNDFATYKFHVHGLRQ